jgi:hypothetical protein
MEEKTLNALLKYEKRILFLIGHSPYEQKIKNVNFNYIFSHLTGFRAYGKNKCQLNLAPRDIPYLPGVKNLPVFLGLLTQSA